MNCMLQQVTDADLESVGIQGTMPMEEEELYATAPMAAVKAYQRLDEEELHTSFEEAISERIIAVRGQLNRISGPLSYSEPARRNTDPLQTWQTPAVQTVSDTLLSKSQQERSTFWQRNKRAMLYGSFAMMCTTLGFDIMGLLMLHMH